MNMRKPPESSPRRLGMMVGGGVPAASADEDGADHERLGADHGGEKRRAFEDTHDSPFWIAAGARRTMYRCDEMTYGCDERMFQVMVTIERLRLLQLRTDR
jgi:hypothetical protein